MDVRSYVRTYVNLSAHARHYLSAHSNGLLYCTCTVQLLEVEKELIHQPVKEKGKPLNRVIVIVANKLHCACMLQRRRGNERCKVQQELWTVHSK